MKKEINWEAIQAKEYLSNVELEAWLGIEKDKRIDFENRGLRVHKQGTKFKRFKKSDVVEFLSLYQSKV